MAKLFTILVIFIFLAGCASSYVTPGGHVVLSSIQDSDIKNIYKTKPSAKFPAYIAFTRIQESGYSSYSSHSYGSGRFSVLTNREIESDHDIERIQKLPGVAGITPLGKIIIPGNISGLKDLRIAAAKLHADILMVYAFDTNFKVGPKKFQASDIISLGFLDNKEVIVFSTASAAFYDAKTGYLYGLAEATERKSQMSDLWDSSSVVDKLRKEAEKSAFSSLIPQIEKTWDGIVKRYNAESHNNRLQLSATQVIFR